jgi:hypothetical protein
MLNDIQAQAVMTWVPALNPPPCVRFTIPDLGVGFGLLGLAFVVLGAWRDRRSVGSFQLPIVRRFFIETIRAQIAGHRHSKRTQWTREELANRPRVRSRR